MTRPVRLLAIGDHGYPTGWERVMRNILTRLDTTGRYDITVRGCGYTADAPYQYPYPVYPITSQTSDDIYGVDQVGGFVETHKPDLLFIVQDLWNVQQYMLEKPPELPCVAYVPVDVPNMKWSYALTVGALTNCVAYTPFGAREIAAGVRDAVDCMLEGERLLGYPADKKRSWMSLPKRGTTFNARLDRLAKAQNLANWSIVPHGMEHGQFHPIDKTEARAAFGLPADAFVVTYVAANQFRKRQDLALRAFKLFLQNYPEAKERSYLLLHSAGGAREMGYDLGQLIRLYGLGDRVVLVDQFQKELSDEQLNALYNAADVNINTAGGEGWGLPIFESAACGIAQIVPNWSVTRDHWKGAASLIHLTGWRHECRMMNAAHAEIDPQHLAQLLMEHYDDPDMTARVGARCKAVADRQASWDQVVDAFDEIFQNALKEPEPVPMTFEEMVAMREGVVQTALKSERVA